MRRPSGFTLIELMIVVVIIGILAAIATPAFIRMRARADEAAVRSNAHSLQLTAEDWSVQNDGVYAGTTGEALPSTGESMRDLLPGGIPPVNPFTDAVSNIVEGGPAAASGELGYDPVVINAVNAGYSITGCGETAGTLVITLVSGN